MDEPNRESMRPIPNQPGFYLDPDNQMWVLAEDDKFYRCTGFVGEKRTGYMCMTDFEHELGNTTATVFPDVESLPECARVDCGYVKVSVIAEELTHVKPSIEKHD